MSCRQAATAAAILTASIGSPGGVVPSKRPRSAQLGPFPWEGVTLVNG